MIKTQNSPIQPSKVQNRLVVFDVEGVLVPKVRFLLFEVAGKKGLQAFIMAAFLGLLYESGLMSLKNALKKLYRLLKGFRLDQFVSFFEEVPLMPGVEETFSEIKEAGYKTALISSGVPRVVVEKLKQRLGADYVSGLELDVSEGILTGEIWGDVIEPDGKAVALKRIIDENGLSSSYCIGIADDRNNLSMFELCDLKIGYNPDFILSRKSDFTTKGELSSIIPFIKGETSRSTGHKLTRNAIIRESIHISSFLIPLFCVHLVNRYIMASLILLMMAVYTVSEVQRMFRKTTPLFSGVTMLAARRSEFQEFVASPIFFALGIALSLFIFPEPIDYVSVTVLTLGDGSASIFGQRFGNIRIPYNKTKYFEGSISGFFFAFLGSMLFIRPLNALIASAVGMFVESLPLPLNDNLAIPLVTGLALIVLSAFI
jgi:HAD superfamily phosphoserine phosphatase-like hydrolase